jgi:hypothetical protein
VLGVVGREPVYAILAMYRLAGPPRVRQARAVVNGACGIPLVWLIDDWDVVEVAEAVAAGVTGAFYRDQLGPDLLRAIRRLAPTPCSVWEQRKHVRPAGGPHLDQSSHRHDRLIHLTA